MNNDSSSNCLCNQHLQSLSKSDQSASFMDTVLVGCIDLDQKYHQKLSVDVAIRSILSCGPGQRLEGLGMSCQESPLCVAGKTFSSYIISTYNKLLKNLT